ncbi:MAG: hypothetical protein PUD43_03210 [Clostridia bacterium]|nr:hypothetical protein [Clostridia bacterium]
MKNTETAANVYEDCTREPIILDWLADKLTYDELEELRAQIEYLILEGVAEAEQRANIYLQDSSPA